MFPYFKAVQLKKQLIELAVDVVSYYMQRHYDSFLAWFFPSLSLIMIQRRYKNQSKFVCSPAERIFFAANLQKHQYFFRSFSYPAWFRIVSS